MQAGQQSDRFYEDRLGWRGLTNTKTKKQIDFMALSSWGPLWLKQSRQMRHKTTSKHELIVTKATPKKNLELKLELSGMSQECLSDSLYAAFWVTAGWRNRHFLSKNRFHTRSSLQASASWKRWRLLDNMALDHNDIIVNREALRQH